MGVYGFVWVRWDVLTLTYKQTTQKRQKWISRVWFPTMYDREISPKRHICVCGHKGVRRDSRGRGWVRMGAGGCISTQQTQNKQTDTQIGPQGIILARVWGGKLFGKDDTWVSQSIWGNVGGVRGTQVPTYALYTAHDVCARGKTRKEA